MESRAQWRRCTRGRTAFGAAARRNEAVLSVLDVCGARARFCTSVREHCNSARVEEGDGVGRVPRVRGTVVVGAATDPGVAALMAAAAHCDASVCSSDGRGISG